MKLKGIKIKAFRLFDDVELSFVNQRFADKGCANFVSVYAPNGFGKTSLFDAIEFGMTSNIRRLKLSNFSENMKNENRLSEFSSFIHNKKLPEEDIHIRLDIEGYKNGVVDRIISKDEEKSLLTGEGHNKFFSEAILSQDWFSEFLSVNNAETRFKLFMENFHESQDLLDYHSQLKTKLKSLALEKGALTRELNNLKKQLADLGTNYGMANYVGQSREITRGYINGSAKANELMRNLEQYGPEAIDLENKIIAEATTYVDVKLDYEQNLRFFNSDLTYSNIVTEPYPADKKSYPVRWVIVALCGLGAFLITILTLFIIENRKKIIPAEK